MGQYLNVGNDGFQAIRRDLYVDKSGLISYINGTLGTMRKLTSVSRPRRFGKSYAAKMLCAYYDKSCDSGRLFEGLKIAEDPSFEKSAVSENIKRYRNCLQEPDMRMSFICPKSIRPCRFFSLN